MKTNSEMNVDAFEDAAVQSSNTAKRLAVGAGLLAGGAAVGGGAVYAANEQDEQVEDQLTVDDVKETADVAGDEPETVEEVTVTQTVTPAPEPVPEPEEPEVSWNETENVYVDGELVFATEKGTIDDHEFMLVDSDGDNLAEILAVDVDKNGQYTEDEIVVFNDSDNVKMGHETANTTNEYFHVPTEPNTASDEEIAQNDPIYNDFSDTKSGEEYDGDFAENNPDYNNEANTDDYMAGNDENYLAENDSYDSDGVGGDEYFA